MSNNEDSAYEITIGVPERAFEVIYLVPSHSVSYALACAESAASADGLLGKRGFRQHDITVSYRRGAS